MLETAHQVRYNMLHGASLEAGSAAPARGPVNANAFLFDTDPLLRSLI